jgi:hypothetical protein
MLSSETFWALMDRWHVPTDRALALIGHDGTPRQSEKADRPFSLSNEQAQVLSCLLEIDLTLAVAAVREHQHRRNGVPSAAGENLPLDAMGRCDVSRAAAALWSTNQATGLAPARPK